MSSRLKFPTRNFSLAGLRHLRSYQPSWLRGDILAGVTVAAYLVPQCMAYAELAGMPPISGWGMGVDRVVALLTKQDNLRDVVLFPLVKPGVAGAGLQEETAVENS